MNEEDQREKEESNEFKEPAEGLARYDTVPYEKRPEEELYAFREALGAPRQPPQPVQVALDATGNPVEPPAAPIDNKKRNILIASAAIVGLGLVLLAIWALQRGPAPPPYVDLGNTNVENSGLSGDFVARWIDKANYVFYVNPLSADNLAGFAAVAANPPRQIEFTIHLKNASGNTVCEKEIVFPFKAPVDGSAVPTQGPPERTMDGDTISYDHGDKGEIVRIEVKGPMVCPENFYDRIAAWDFTTTYPVKGDQNDWVQSLERGGITKQVSSTRQRRRPASPAQVLPAPIEGDDVIVGDNRSRGTVLTRAGREFFVGPGGLSSHGEGWGIFPATFHFHCDVQANCTLTRAGASAVVSARLMK
ncbi:MAG: hypothetical protein WAL75_22725 [Terracidiphilus sp.]